MDKEKSEEHEERREGTRCEEMVRSGKKETGRGRGHGKQKGVQGKEMTTPRQALFCID